MRPLAAPCIVLRIFSQLSISLQTRSEKSGSRFTPTASLHREGIRGEEEPFCSNRLRLSSSHYPTYQEAKAHCQSSERFCVRSNGCTSHGISEPSWSGDCRTLLQRIGKMRIADNSKDTFRLTGKKFQVGWQTLHLNPQLKREVTICNLFTNHGLAVTDIMRILDENYENVIHSLINHKILLDRRQQPRETSSDDLLHDGHADKPRNLLVEAFESLFGFRN